MFTLDKSMDKISKTYPIEIQKSFLELTQKYEEFKFIFTDASKTKDNVGCAMIYEEDQQLYNLPEQCSIFSGEAIAILKALSYIQLYYIQDSGMSHWVVATDSWSVLTAIDSPLPSNSLIKQIINVWRETKIKGATVVFMWVPAHCGIAGNEMPTVQPT